MKNFLIILLLILPYFTLAVEAPSTGAKKVPTKQQENNTRYNRELNHFLLNSDDLKIQLSAFYSHSKINTNQAIAKNILDKAINTSSDAYTLFLADRICHNSKMLTEWCHQQNIHQIHYAVDPENFYTYLFDLHKEDNELIIQSTIAQAVERSTYANSFFFEYIIEVAEQIDIFNEENPGLYADSLRLNNSEKLNYIKELESKIFSLQLIEKGIAPPDYQQKSNDSMSITTAIGIEMARAIPYTQLTRFCRKAIDANSCLKIGELMKKDGKLMDQMIGIGLINSAQKTMVIDIDIVSDNKQREQSYKQYICYVQIPDVSYALMVNKDLTTQYILDAKEFGELEAIKKMVFNVHTIEEEHGFIPDFHPHDC